MSLKKLYTIGLILLCLTLVYGCEREEDIQSAEPPPTQQLSTFSTQHTEEGVLKWTLVGETSEIRENKASGNKVIIQNPKVQIFEEGKVSITLTSKTGELFSTGLKRNNVYLKGNVVGVNQNGKLHTEELEWRNKDETLYSPTEVKVVRGDSTWYGTEMVANPNLETVKMSNNRFRLYSKDEEIHE